MMQILQPPSWATPAGLLQRHRGERRHHRLHRRARSATTGQGVWEEKGFAGQFRQALANILEVLAEAGGRPEHLVRLTWYVLDKQEYLGALKDVGAAYRELIGRHYPVMAVLQVSGLVEAEARLEIEATAVIPD